MWELDCEESWVPKNWWFWTVVLEKTLESPLDCKEIQPVHSEGDQPWDFVGRLDAKAESPVLWPPHVKSWVIGKDSDARRDWWQEKGMTEDEMAGWHHWLDGRESEWTAGFGDGQGGLVCCDSWGRKESDTTELLIWSDCPQGIQARSLALGLMMQSFPSCPAPTHWWWMPAFGPFLYLCLYLWLDAYSVCVCFFFFPLLAMLPTLIPKLSTDTSVRGFSTVWKLLLPNSLPRTGLHLWIFYHCFCFLYFVLPPFEEFGLPFWVPCVLCQSSEVVLWKLLSTQMIFWWICGGESGLPILFLCHLVTTLSQNNYFFPKRHSLGWCIESATLQWVGI